MNTKNIDISGKTSSESRPKYQRVRDHLYAEIHSGRLEPGRSLPTEAKLAESMGLSRQTVRQAFAELEEDGVIIRVRGKGTFVTTEQQRVAKKQSNLFAFIAPEMQSGMYPSFLEGFQQACSGFGHQTLVGSSGNDIGRQADLLMQMMLQAVGGIAIVPTPIPETPSHQLRLLQENQIPVVMCHRTVQGISAPSVVYSGREIGLMAGECLRDHGHRRIAILHMRRYSMVDAYERGLRDAFENVGLTAEGVVSAEYGTDLTAPHPQAIEALREQITKLLARSDRPTAIYCGNSNDAEIVYMQAVSMGLNIPDDLSLISFNSKLRGHGLAGEISSVAIDECELGKCAAELLYEMRSGKRAIDNGEQIQFPASLLPGNTVGPVPSKGK